MGARGLNLGLQAFSCTSLGPTPGVGLSTTDHAQATLLTRGKAERHTLHSFSNIGYQERVSAIHLRQRNWDHPKP
jgi:hypothetical protein